MSNQGGRGMKRMVCLLLVCLLVLTACGTKAEPLTWQEQYDLGVRYLSEGNYEEAILAFNAAIEIDPQKPEAYVKLSETYEMQGNRETAKSVLEQAVERLGELDLLQEALEPYRNADVDLTGQWVHEQYPNPYYMTLRKNPGGTYTFYMESVRGNYAQIATTTVENVEFVGGKAEFSYEDSFLNSGKVYLTVDGEKLHIRFETKEPYQGNWCVDSGAGTYVRMPASQWDGFRVTGTCTFVQDGTGQITVEEYLPRITMKEDGTFLFAINCLEFMSWVSGTYQLAYNEWGALNEIRFEIDEKGVSGVDADHVDSFCLLRGENDGFYYQGNAGMGATYSGSAFYLAGEGAAEAKMWVISPAVSNAYEEQIDGYWFQIPQVFIENIPTDTVNAKIYEDLYPTIESVHKEGIAGGPYGIVYSWNCNGDILSLFVKTGEWNGGYIAYEVYNISLTTGKLMTLSEMMAVYGMTEDEFQKKTFRLMEEKFKVPNWELSEEFIQEGIDRTFSQENMAAVKPFVNEYGRLCVAVRLETFVGGGMYYFLYDLETGEDCYVDWIVPR